MINDMPKSTDKVEPRRNPYRNARSRKVKNTLANVERPGEPRNPALVDANSNGFPTLPVEIHLEILSHLSCQPIPCTYSKALGDTDRFDAISALSRTCRALHNVYNPLFWRTVEARGWRCREHDGSLPEVYIAQDLRAYSSVLTRAPHLAEFVQPGVIVPALARHAISDSQLPADEDDDYVREAKKAFCSVTKVWKRVHTIQLEDRPWAIELFGRWRGDQVMEMAKKTLQSNLALKENRDVVEGEIKIWQPSHRLREVISVPRHVEDD
ncbi:hypothetical protein BDZ89DRAFT_1173084 [Hymenopellis radicata]|nr:hypothetical protein BDZ89DRAFT_1173084 [Hymenopellis radicata]